MPAQRRSTGNRKGFTTISLHDCGFTLINRGAIKARHSGFTLIELMIAVAIIAVISAVGIVTYSQSQKLARDSRRKQDLKQIQKALAFYYQDNGRYPCTAGWQTSDYTSGPLWIRDEANAASAACGTKTFSSSYISVLPKDPMANTATPWTTGQYGYGYHSAYASDSGTCKAAGQFYYLIAQLENSNDKEAHVNFQYKNCDGTVQPWINNLYAIYSN